MADFKLGNAAGDIWTTKSPSQTAGTMSAWEAEHNSSVISNIVPGDMGTGIYPWFNVKDPLYGALGDGSTDDTSAIQAAIDAAEATGRGAEVIFPQGSYIVTASINIRGTVLLRGSGAGHYGVPSGGNVKTGTTVQWSGAGNGAIFDFTSAASGELIRYAGIEKMLIHGGSLAEYGIRMSGTSSCTFRDLRLEGYANPCIAVINLHNGVYINQFNLFENIITSSTGTDGCPLLIEGITAIGGNAQNMFIRCTFSFGGAGDTADGIRMDGNVDNCIFYGVHAFNADAENPQIGADGHGLRFIGNANGLPRNNLFVYYVGSVKSTGGCRGNTILHATAESFSVEAGATEQINYQIIDNALGGWYKSPTLAIRDEFPMPVGSWLPLVKSGYTLPDNTTGTHDIEQRYGCINFTNSVKGRISANVCMPYHWGQGKVVGMRLFYLKQDGTSPTGTASRTARFEVSVGRRDPPTTGFVGIAMTLQVSAEGFTVNVPDGEDNLMEADITFATPVTADGNQFWLFTIDRIGDDATNDTLSVDDSDGFLSFMGAMVKFEGKPSTGQSDDPQYPRRGTSQTE